MKRSPFTVVVLALAALAAALSVTLVDASWDRALSLSVTRVLGWTALASLFAALTISPAARLVALLRPALVVGAAPLRRAFGISAAVLALVHAAGALFGPLDGALAALGSWTYLRAGLVALAILSALLVTSFPAAVRALRIRLWKPLHRLAYVAAALVLVHLALSPFAPRAVTLWSFVALAAIGVARFVPRESRQRSDREESSPAGRVSQPPQG